MTMDWKTNPGSRVLWNQSERSGFFIGFPGEAAAKDTRGARPGRDPSEAPVSAGGWTLVTGTIDWSYRELTIVPAELTIAPVGIDYCSGWN